MVLLSHSGDAIFSVYRRLAPAESDRTAPGNTAPRELKTEVTAGISATPANDAVVQFARNALGKLVNKAPSALPLEKSVLEIGADELTVVEWVMALEAAYKIRIPDSVTIDPKTRSARKDLSISRLAAAVSAALLNAKK